MNLTSHHGHLVEPPPIYWQNLSEKDQQTLQMPDALFKAISWMQLREITQTAVTQGLLQRQPSVLRKYLEYSYRIRMRYGSIYNYIITERLKWNNSIVSMGTTFADCRDWAILWNDWPYGIENNIVHLIVWTKFPLNQDSETGELMPEAKDMINQFVDDTFGKAVGGENVLRFKNIKSLSSVHEIEHFHVMLKNPDPIFLQWVTNGDTPVQEVAF
ncbi:N-acetylglucosamine-induced protein 1 [Erysiphe necator]|nr:N-acetylglucosamine-induced protein 1 [Erysiphe necator]